MPTALRLVFALYLLSQWSVAQEEAPITTPLHQAVFNDRTNIALDMIEKSTSVDQKNRYGVAPLSLACQNGNLTLVKALLKAGADPNTTLAGGESVLMTAARTGKVDIVHALLNHQAKPNHKERKGQCALMWAAAEGHTEVGKALIEAGAPANRKLGSGFSPLLFAVRAGHTDFVKMLVEYQVDINQQSPEKKRAGRRLPSQTTPIRVAVENGHFETAIYLLEQGADPNEIESGNSPILHVLTWVRKPHRGDNLAGMPPPTGSGSLTSLEFARIIIEKHGAKVNQKQKKGSSGGNSFGTRGATPILLGLNRADFAYIKLLHELGADLSIPNADGTTALLALTGVGSRTPEEEAGTEEEALEILQWLLPKIDIKQEINIVTKPGDTAMHGAAYRNWPTMATKLDQLGADPKVWNQQNKRTWTPLLIAQGHRQVNFKPDAKTTETFIKLMKSHNIAIPPERPPK